MKEHEQEGNICGKYSENSRQHDCESVVCYSFFLVIFKNNGFKGFLAITNQPRRIIEFDFKGSRSAIDFVVFRFNFTERFIKYTLCRGDAYELWTFRIKDRRTVERKGY